MFHHTKREGLVPSLLNRNAMKRLIPLFVLIMAGCTASNRFESVDATRFGEVIKHPEVQLVDVRTADEYNSGHIVGAENMDVNQSDFDSRVATLDKHRPVALYCRSGRRSKIAAERVATHGFTVIELDGGILSWHGEVE